MKFKLTASILFLCAASLLAANCNKEDASKNPANPANPEDKFKAPPDVAKAPADAKKTKGGVAYKILQKGTGADAPNPWDTVKAHYTGWTTDGKMFDSSLKNGSQPASFSLLKVIPGWSEAIQQLTVGGKGRFWIPEEMAYKGIQGAPQGTLVFDIELVDLIKTPPPPPAPDDVAAPPADAQKTNSGIAYKVLQPGTGKERPVETSKVTVHYTGWTTDGKMFDSSITRNQPANFSLNQVIKGWTEGLQLMTKGEKRRFWIPEELAYKGQPGRPQGTLVFDVELIDFAAPPETPKDVAAPPKTALKTKSGLASVVLSKGEGKDHPAETSTVTVHYSGWTTDGKMFDSSVMRGSPASFPLTNVIKGWTEGLQLMVKGEKRRFWIPEELAYKGQPGRPQGMLVFDVELIDFK